MWDTPVSFHPRSPDDCGERNRGNCVSRLPKCKPECIRSSKSVAGQKPRTHPWGAEAWVSAPAWNWLFFFFFWPQATHTPGRGWALSCVRKGHSPRVRSSKTPSASLVAGLGPWAACRRLRATAEARRAREREALEAASLPRPSANERLRASAR